MLTIIKRAIRAVFPVPSEAAQSVPTEPRASPVPWIADEVWTDWQYWINAPLPADYPTIEHPDLIPVEAEDLDRAPHATVPQGVPVPQPGSFTELVQQLATTPPASGVRSPCWPLCCGRLATLINHQGDGLPIEQIEVQTGPLDRAFLVGDLRSNWGCKSEDELADAMKRGYGESLSELREDGMSEGLVIFQCRACGRVYVGGCHP